MIEKLTAQEQRIDRSLTENKIVHKASVDYKLNPIVSDLSYEFACSNFIPRNVFEQYLFYPEFENFSKGQISLYKLDGLVRVKLDDNSYRVASVVELSSCEKYYRLGTFNTNRTILVTHGSSKKEFTLDFTSNSVFTEVFDTRCFRRSFHFGNQDVFMIV